MSQTGSLLVHVFASRAQLPIAGATVAVSRAQPDGRYELLSLQMTDSSGVAGPIVLEAPDAQLSQEQNSGAAIPYASYTVLVEHPDYQMALFRDLQVFAGIETLQNVPLMPLSEPAGQQETDAQESTVTPQEL